MARGLLNALRLAAALIIVLVGLLPLQAAAADASQCQSSGGPLLCQKAALTYVTSGPQSVGERFANADQACKAVIAGMTNPVYTSPQFILNHPLWGTVCQYDLLYPNATSTLRAFYQNWVLPHQWCLPEAVGQWVDTSQTDEARGGRLWCQYAAPVEPAAAAGGQSCPATDGQYPGHPIAPASGEKLRFELDWQDGGAAALSLRRTYRSSWASDKRAGGVAVELLGVRR